MKLMFYMFFFLGLSFLMVLSMNLSVFIFGVGLVTMLLMYLGWMIMLGEGLGVSLSEEEVYECGFESFYKLGGGFSVQFFIVGLSFMLFDLEICLFLPGVGGVVTFYVTGGYMMIFLIIVLFVLVYEYLVGGLSW
uniref:NADH-ubiquinone oxidoreductase chain 3 n=1 Tax=Microcosmus sulcatus TaxID=341086 RepID=D2YVG7_9ASCI|nr:NADH dehydrogenase subunit 3 [Microcosmus sulcatus]CAL23090.2 NADH dehydrogenase subunit 3 [Microcosmus sulcatus]